jgi:hypothetical protein
MEIQSIQNFNQNKPLKISKEANKEMIITEPRDAGKTAKAEGGNAVKKSSPDIQPKSAQSDMTQKPAANTIFLTSLYTNYDVKDTNEDGRISLQEELVYQLQYREEMSKKQFTLKNSGDQNGGISAVNSSINKLQSEIKFNRQEGFIKTSKEPQNQIYTTV